MRRTTWANSLVSAFSPNNAEFCHAGKILHTRRLRFGSTTASLLNPNATVLSFVEKDAKLPGIIWDKDYIIFLRYREKEMMKKSSNTHRTWSVSVISRSVSSACVGHLAETACGHSYFKTIFCSNNFGIFFRISVTVVAITFVSTVHTHADADL